MKFSRRNFIAGASAIAMVASNPKLASAFRGGLAALPSNLLTAKTLLSGFDLNEGLCYAFMNFAKSATSVGASSSYNFAAFMNSDGYPNASYTGQGNGWTVSQTMDSALVAPTVTWVLDWQGLGGIEIANGTTFGNPNFVITNIGAGTTINGASSVPTTITNVLIASGNNGYVEFTNSAGAVQFNLSFYHFLTYDGTMRNLRLYRKSDQVALNAGGIFTPEYLSYMRTLNPKVIRTMDWTSTNGSNFSNYTSSSNNYRCPTTAFSYLTTRFFPNLYAGSTSGTDTYTCVAPTDWSGSLVDGATVQVQFTNANTSTTPTLAVGTTAATTIVTPNNSPITITAGLPTTIAAGCQATLIYDAWLNVWVGSFSVPSNFQAGGGLTSTMPIEMQIALCNQLNCHLWINIPFYYTNAAVTSLAAYISANLNSNLNCYFEYTNEHWNTQFTQFTMCNARGAFLGFPNSSGRRENGYYGLRVRQVMTLVTAAWAPRSTSTLRRVYAVSAQGGGSASDQQNYGMNGADLFVGNPAFTNGNYATTINANFNVGSPTFSRPVDGCEVQSYANYYAGPVMGNNSGALSALNVADLSTLTGAADNFASGATAAAFAFVDNDIRQGVVGSVTASLPSGISGNAITTTANNFSNAGGNINVVVCSVSAGGTFPSDLSPGTVYFVIAGTRTSTSIQLSATNGGTTPITISGGTGTLTIGSLGGETLLWFSTFVYATWESIAASYDGARPSGFSNIKVECYEGALESIASSQEQCTSVGISTTYGTTGGSNSGGYRPQGTGGKIYNMLIGYKNNTLASQLVQDQMTQFMASAHSVTPAWFSPMGPNQWALNPGDVFTAPFQTYYGNAAFNH